eukprot:5255381-Pyramimonas_sp.AAC.1
MCPVAARFAMFLCSMGIAGTTRNGAARIAISISSAAQTSSGTMRRVRRGQTERERRCRSEWPRD